MNDDAILDTCGCCEGTEPLTPASVENPPGLSAVAYRMGTHAAFKETMLAKLSSQTALRDLTTRESDDPSIALLDAAATMLDVLTFYQERIANEGYLRTATERRSILELARSIGYQLSPGVAASTYLAFTLEEAPGSPQQVLIDKGTKVQSLPGPGEQAQTFETIEAIEARPEWNALKPQQTRMRKPAFASGDTLLYLEGTTTNLKPGDAVLLIGDERKNDSGKENWDFRRVTRITPLSAADPAGSYTVVELDRELGSRIPSVEPAKENPKVYALRVRANLFGYNAPDWRSMPKSTKASYLGMTESALQGNQDLLLSAEWPNFTIAAISDPPTDVATGIGVYGEYFDNADFTSRKLARTDATINFEWGSGSPAPGIIASDTFSVRWTGWVQAKVTGNHTFSTSSEGGVRLWVDGKLIINNWTIHKETENSGAIRLEKGKKYDIKLEFYENGGNAVIKLSWGPPGLGEGIIPAAHLYPRDIHNLHLDTVYSQLVKGSWVVLSVPDYQEVYSIESVAEDSRANFALSAKTTRVTLKGENLREKYNERLRETAVFAQSEELPMAAQPIPDPVQGNTITLDRLVLGLEEKRTLIVTGKRMRVAVLEAMNIVATDGVSTVNLQVGNSLLLEETPTTLPTGQQVWTLTDKNGFTGTAKLASGAKAKETFNRIPSEPDDPIVSEVAVIKDPGAGTNPTMVALKDPLLRSYDPPTVVIYANVAKATHGETKREVLGSGQAGQRFQSFALKQKPLTCVSASTASGRESTLEVRVNDILWDEVPSLYDRGPKETVYTTHITDDGTVGVEFGDGQTGSRLPTGTENVVATYRVGTGLAGLVKSGQLSLLMSRPLGLKGVTNPLAPSGAADPETRDQARRNAPFTVLTLDRIVSLKDYEDFARAFPGIGKAQAIELQWGEQRLVHLTVAGAEGAEVKEDSDLYEHLKSAISDLSDPHQGFMIESYASLQFKIKANLGINPRYIAEKVIAAVRDVLYQSFSFEQRAFAQGVSPSEVIALIQAAEGVEWIDLEELSKVTITSQSKTPMVRVPQPIQKLTAGLPKTYIGSYPFYRGLTFSVFRRQSPIESLDARTAGWLEKEPGKTRPAELLTLKPGGVELEEVKPK